MALVPMSDVRSCAIRMVAGEKVEWTKECRVWVVEKRVKFDVEQGK